jgi:V/A-type H+-transporting ATPase subunit K
LSSIALFFSAIRQGACCASAINASKAKPEIFGLSVAPAAIVEGFAVFVLIFTLVISAGMPLK